MLKLLSRTAPVFFLAFCAAAIPALAATNLKAGSSHNPYTISNQLDERANPDAKGPDDTTRQRALMIEAQGTLESLLSDPDYPSLLSLATRAKAVLIVPRLLRLSFFLGGHGGSGVLLARSAGGKWSNPAFYTIGGINYGFQIGGQSSELILAIMSEKGLEALLKHELTLGADAGASIGTLGRGAKVATGMGEDADVYAFTRSEGLYVGVALDGTVITPDSGWNEALYGKGATPKGILVEQRYSTPFAEKLVGAMP
jgi:lipid-binding SYLF domain-containing protein